MARARRCRTGSTSSAGLVVQQYVRAEIAVDVEVLGACARGRRRNQEQQANRQRDDARG